MAQDISSSFKSIPSIIDMGGCCTAYRMGSFPPSRNILTSIKISYHTAHRHYCYRRMVTAGSDIQKQVSGKCTRPVIEHVIFDRHTSLLRHGQFPAYMVFCPADSYCPFAPAYVRKTYIRYLSTPEAKIKHKHQNCPIPGSAFVIREVMHS